MAEQSQIEITFIDGNFRVAVFARSGRGDEMVRPMVWQGDSYDDAIMASERYARVTGLPVADLVVRGLV